jgi:alpha-ribazole phosphatase/probable phosphoglycerate mutase
LEFTPITQDVTRIIMIRHGEVDNHEAGIFNGQMDVDITPRGVKHMERAAEFIAEAGVKKIYSSNLKRTVRGAKIISNQIGFNESREVVPEIKEIHLGEWQGLSGDEIDSLYPGMREERYANIEHFRIPGGETLTELSERVVPAVTRIAMHHQGEAIAIVAHAGPNRVFLCQVLGLSLERVYHIQQDYGAINVINYSDNHSTVLMMNG